MVHTAHQHARRVVRLGHPRRIRPRRRLIYQRRSLHSQRFVRTLFVTLLAEAIEGPLLRPPVGRCRLRRLLLQRAMHALVSPVGVSCQLRHNVTLKDNDSVSFIPIIPGTDANLNC